MDINKLLKLERRLIRAKAKKNWKEAAAIVEEQSEVIREAIDECKRQTEQVRRAIEALEAAR